jgi:DNA-binding MarR family transcriptional regulator
MADAWEGPRASAAYPDWVPEGARRYLLHVEAGLSLRALARGEGCHASTILRQVRRMEARRDDPLVDEALRRLTRDLSTPADPPERPESQDDRAMTPTPRAPNRSAAAPAPDEETLNREARRILRRLSESGAMLVVAPEFAQAVVLRELPDGRSARTAVVARTVAQAFALKDWIERRGNTGRVATYGLTAAGRAALKRLLAEEAALRGGFAEAATPFADQHREIEERPVEPAPDAGTPPRRVRYNAAESPLAILGRRREKDGRPFLSPELVDAGERLREDFELAQMGPRVAQNWDRFLTAGVDRGQFRPGTGGGSEAARARVAAALAELGPGLGDVALRVCCFLEGLEAAERRMGWSARSGKIVLRIALQRLRRHYDQTGGRYGGLIG